MSELPIMETGALHSGWAKLMTRVS